MPSSSSGTLNVYLDSDKKLSFPTWGFTSGTYSSERVSETTPKCYTSPPSQRLKLPSKARKLKQTRPKSVTVVKRGGKRMGASKPDSSEGIVAPAVLAGSKSGSEELWDWTKCLDLVFVKNITGDMRSLEHDRGFAYYLLVYHPVKLLSKQSHQVWTSMSPARLINRSYPPAVLMLMSQSLRVYVCGSPLLITRTSPPSVDSYWCEDAGKYDPYIVKKITLGFTDGSSSSVG